MKAPYAEKIIEALVLVVEERDGSDCVRYKNET